MHASDAMHIFRVDCIPAARRVPAVGPPPTKMKIITGKVPPKKTFEPRVNVMMVINASRGACQHASLSTTNRMHACASRRACQNATLNTTIDANACACVPNTQI